MLIVHGYLQHAAGKRQESTAYRIISVWFENVELQEAIAFIYGDSLSTTDTEDEVGVRIEQ